MARKKSDFVFFDFLFLFGGDCGASELFSIRNREFWPASGTRLTDLDWEVEFETVEVSLGCEEMNFEPISPVNSLLSESVEVAEEPLLSTTLSMAVTVVR